MDLEDLEPKKGKPQLKNLDPLGLEELKEYIVALEAEIERARAEISKKEQHRKGLDGLFKS